MIASVFKQNFPLQSLNTLAIPAIAEIFCEVNNLQQVDEAIQWAKHKSKGIQVLGGGSNVLLPDKISGVVVHPVNQGIEILEDTDEVLISVAAGQNWHHLVETTLARGWYGLENLALIPGNVGAAPIQNIGAYGVELKDFFHSLQAVDLETGERLTLSNSDCQFGYRHSIFKAELAGRLLIYSVSLRLSKIPRLQLHYPALQQLADQTENLELTPIWVAETVAAIRRSKLPDPARLANVGSFFKNPLVSSEQAKQLQSRYPGLVSYPAGDASVKLAAGWLIDQAGWKGRREGNVGVHDQQALVLVNYGRAGVKEVVDLAELIQQDILDKFGVLLEVEPQQFS